jgi:hypothetical protein
MQNVTQSVNPQTRPHKALYKPPRVWQAVFDRDVDAFRAAIEAGDKITQKTKRGWNLVQTLIFYGRDPRCIEMIRILEKLRPDQIMEWWIESSDEVLS